MTDWKSSMLEYFFSINSQNRDIIKGLEIKYQNMPPKLFKYCSFSDYKKKDLLNNTVHLSYPDNFNDPYDCSLTCSDSRSLIKQFFILNELNYPFSKLSNESKKKLIASDVTVEYNEMYDVIMRECFPAIPFGDPHANGILDDYGSVFENVGKKISNGFKKSVVIACFSEINDSMLMWSHYADNHRAFCLEYDFKSLTNSKEIAKLLYPVIYQQEMFNITKYMLNFSANTDGFYKVRAAITKSSEWSYEKEWRLILPTEHFPNVTSIKIPLPQKIYAGSKITKENKYFLESFVENKNIPLYHGSMNEKMFRLEFKEQKGETFT